MENNKPDLIKLVKHWIKRTGRQSKEAVYVMLGKNLEITESQFKADFKEHPKRATHYDSYEIMALIHAFHDGINAKTAARAFEALLAFEWAGVTRVESGLIGLFGEREMELAVRRFNEYVQGKPYHFEDYINFLPTILGYVPIRATGYSLPPVNDSDFGRQIESAKKLLWSGKTSAAKTLLQRLLKEALQRENQGIAVPELANIHQQIGIIHTNRGKHVEAQDCLQVALDFAIGWASRTKQAKDAEIISAIYGNMAANAYYAGDYAGAAKFYQLCYNEAEKACVLTVEVFALTGLGVIDMEKQQYATATARFTSAYMRAKEEKFWDRAGYIALNFSYLYMLLENDALAEVYLKQGFEHVEKIENPQLKAQLHCQKARLKVNSKDNYAGDSELSLAMGLAEESGNHWLLQSIRLELAKSHLRGYRDAVAIAMFKEILADAMTIKHPELVAQTLYGVIFSLLAHEFMMALLPLKLDASFVRKQIGEQMMRKIQSLALSSDLLEKTVKYFRIGLDNYPPSVKDAVTKTFYQVLNRL